MSSAEAIRGPARRPVRLAVASVLAATAVTATMDATGLFLFSALALFPLLVVFWLLQRLPRRQMGFVLGNWRHYGLALLHPLLVLSVLTAISAASGAVDISHTDWAKAGLNVALLAVSTILVAILTEEGFFRGWLWAALEHSGRSRAGVLVWTCIAFALWHVPAVLLETGFALPARQVPVFLANAAVMGAAWGLVRSISGSVVAASVSHGVWNGAVYSLFGYGTKVGALGIRETAMYGPEVGVLGLLLNIVFVAALWLWHERRASE